MLCWQCGAEVPVDAETCPECDAPIGEMPKRSVRRGELRCPACGCVWEEEYESCPECGASPADDALSPDEGDW